MNRWFGIVVAGFGLFLSRSVLLAQSAPVPVESQLNRRAMVQPVPREAMFSDPKWHTWCGAPIRTADGKCHLFYSRWPLDKGFAPVWVLHS